MSEDTPARVGNPDRWDGHPFKTVLPRRIAFTSVVLVSIALLTGWLAAILGRNAFGFVDVAMLILFVVNIMWVTVAFWNSFIGFIILLGARNPVAVAAPLLQYRWAPLRPDVRVAIVITIRDEDPLAVFARLRTMKGSLDYTDIAQQVHYFILSDSSHTEIIAAEQSEFEAFRILLSDKPTAVFYRHRPTNTGFKAGNVREFCTRCGGEYTYMVLLDADSLMTGRAIVRHIEIMEANPKIAILQSLIVNILSPSLFARVYDFGHRHAMRCSIAGAGWWQGDRCQYWGHNATIRLGPFVEHCELPTLPGNGPLAGHIICHDQIEAMLVHRAGYEVRVVPWEDGSYEATPPTFFDFTKRNHRWCHGNLQNLQLVMARSIPLIDRFHIVNAAVRFLAWPALVVFIILSAVSAAASRADTALFNQGGLYFTWMFMLLAPRLLGLGEAAFKSRDAYGGIRRLFIGGLLEVVFTILLLPLLMVSATGFMISLMSGRGFAWSAQTRNGYKVSWREAFQRLWPHTAFGATLAAWLVITVPTALAWFLPFLCGLLLAIPFTVVTAMPRWARWASDTMLCSMPEDMHSPWEVARLVDNATAGARLNRGGLPA
jgi:membrane glycosyltransferase